MWQRYTQKWNSVAALKQQLYISREYDVSTTILAHYKHHISILKRSLQILALFPFSVLYPQLYGIQDKHMFVINMGCSVGMACTHKLRKVTWIRIMVTWFCVFKPQSFDVFNWTSITTNMWQIQKTRIWLSITWNALYLPKRNGMAY